MPHAFERIAFTLIMALVPVIALLVARDWPVRASIVILFLGSIGGILGLVQLCLDFKAVKEGAVTERLAFDIEGLQYEGRWGALEIWGWLWGLFVAIHLVGFLVVLPSFVFLDAEVYGARCLTAIVLAAITFCFLYGVF